jgi:hypothetical protein
MKDFSEVSIPVQTKEPFSYFRLTQTGKDTHNMNYFQLNYLEQF